MRIHQLLPVFTLLAFCGQMTGQDGLMEHFPAPKNGDTYVIAHRDGIHDAFSTSNWGILGFHASNGTAGRKYDYCVDVKPGGAAIPAWQIYGFDTGPHEGVKAIQPDEPELLLKYLNSKDLH